MPTNKQDQARLNNIINAFWQCPKLVDPVKSKCVTSGKGGTYREIRINTWPTQVHYQFTVRGSQIRVDFDWQLEDRPGLQACFVKIQETCDRSAWGNGNSIYGRYQCPRHGIRLHHDENQSPCAIANRMVEFINATFQMINPLAEGAK